jgi:ribosomal protein S18 acetylase RimI-like enzyme
MKMKTHIAGLAEAEEIAALWKRFMTEEKEVIPEADPQAAEEGWTERLRNQIADAKLIVAADRRTLVGFLGFIDHNDRQWVPPGVAYIVDIYVVPEARNGTAARALFQAAARLLPATYSETWMNTHMTNRRMQVLLRRAGFESLDDFRIEGLKDQIYYRRDNNVAHTDGSSGTLHPRS